MTAQEFCFWLQGYFDISKASQMGEEQVSIVRAQLSNVFHNKTKDTLVNPLKGLNPGVIFIDEYLRDPNKKPPSA